MPKNEEESNDVGEIFLMVSGRFHTGRGQATDVYYDAHSLNRIARAASRRSGKNAPERVDDDDARIAIVFSAATVEAYLKQFVDEASRFVEDGCKAAELRKQLELLVYLQTDGRRGGEAEQTWKNATMLFTGTPLDEGSEPFQSFKLLTRLRNRVLHLPPEEIEVLDGKRMSPAHDLAKQLRDKQLIEKINEDTSVYRTNVKCYTPKVARWACDTAVQVVEHFIGIAPGEFGEDLQDRRSELNKV